MKLLFMVAVSVSFILTAISCSSGGDNEEIGSAVSSSSSYLSSSSSDIELSSSSSDIELSSSSAICEIKSLLSSSSFVTVVIGEQTWMKLNLDVEPIYDNNCAATNSWCYDNIQANCDKYGRLYDWATAMALPDKCNTTRGDEDYDCIINSPHKGLCPVGYHIPTDTDWDKLFRYVDEQNYGEGLGIPYNSDIAGKHLKAKEGWINCGSTDKDDHECFDTYGFAALPGGGRYLYGNFDGIGIAGDWWSAGDNSSNGVYRRNMSRLSNGASWTYTSKIAGFSVRCVKD